MSIACRLIEPNLKTAFVVCLCVPELHDINKIINFRHWHHGVITDVSS